MADHSGRLNKAVGTSMDLNRGRPMKFQRIEFSWRAAFIGLYMTPEGDKVWLTILPFFPLYFKRVGVPTGAEQIKPGSY
jgi:hypothetical protein